MSEGLRLRSEEGQAIPPVHPRLDERLPAVPLERTVVRRLWTTGVFVWFEIFALVALAVEGFLVYQLVAEGFTLAAWARFLLPNVLCGPPLARRLARLVRDRRTSLILRERSLRYEAAGKAVEIDYRDVSGYWVRDQDGPWLRVATRDGRELEVTGRLSVTGRIPKEDVVRVLGPRVLRDAIQERGLRPTEPIEAYLWDHYGDPPPVTMVPGKRYRYRKGFPPDSAKTLNVAFWIFFGQFAVRFGKDLLTLSFDGFSFLIMCMLAVAVLPLWSTIHWHSAANDRFERTDDGLWVIRGKRRWRLADPRPATVFPFRSIAHGRPAIRYGRGFRTYLFDPRFIEEDV